MDAIRVVLTLLAAIIKESPKTALFLAILGFLAFMLYGAITVADEGIWILILYLILAVAALLLLTLIAIRFYSN